MDTGNNQKRNRLIALCFASVLLVLLYGPLANWFVAADRTLYDQFAGHISTAPLDNGIIISLDARQMDQSQVLDRYGRIIALLRDAHVRRIVLTEPPPIAAPGRLPGWAATLGSGVPVYVPTRHRLAEFAAGDGFVEFIPDSDGVLRRSGIWQLNNNRMSPSLAFALALDNDGMRTGQRMSSAVDAVYLSNYTDIPRLDPDDLLDQTADRSVLQGATVFVDTEPALIGATSVLPSGQLVTNSEIVATLLANFEQGRAIIAPSWVVAMEWLAPILLSIVAVLFMPDRSRREIAMFALITVGGLLLAEAILVFALHVRLDLGRPILIFASVAVLCSWLVVGSSKSTHNTFKRGSDFLSAGRLEPAFAEFRRCNPSDTVSTVMYKLSLAFEEQAKPERAEAVLEWLKRTHGGAEGANTSNHKLNGAPRRLGRYVVERRIGRGAMGAVYLARDPRINRPVAVKAIPIEQEFEDEELKEARLRFYREAESAGRLTHPNIVTVFDAGEDNGLAYIAMEYVPGIPLTKFTDPKKLLAPKRALELAAVTAEALDYAHNQGVIHRDIKPANLLYDPKAGSLKISDFGVARLTDNNRTKTGIVLGTPMYMSPEQLGAEKLSGHSDLFSLGVTLYELLAGEVPFKASNIAALMTKITTDHPEPVSNRRAGIPPSVDTVIAKAMAKRPEDRFTCGAEMAIALRNCAAYT